MLGLFLFIWLAMGALIMRSRRVEAQREKQRKRYLKPLAVTEKNDRNGWRFTAVSKP